MQRRDACAGLAMTVSNHFAGALHHLDDVRSLGGAATQPLGKSLQMKA